MTMTFLARATVFAALVAMVAGNEIECNANGDDIACEDDIAGLLQAKVAIAAKTLTGYGDGDGDGTQLATKSLKVGGQCEASCWGSTCDDWVQLGKDCELLTGTDWGCDCSGCSSCMTCKATCYDKTCDQWVQNGFTCDELKGDSWGCDCSGCPSCNQVPTPTPPTQQPTTQQPIATCKASCWGNTCDYWAQAETACDELKGTSWDCDCSGCSSCQQVPAEPTFAVIPVKWKVITKFDGTGQMTSSDIATRMDGLNARFRGQNVDTSDMTKVLQGSDCLEKCRAALCDQNGVPSAIDQSTKDKVESECYCSTTPNFCDKYGFNEMQGPYQNTGIQFTLAGVDHVPNDEWYLQCCCSNAAFNYEIKQNEIFDQLIEKATVRSVATLIICDMQTLGASTSGQSSIPGEKYCPGGPGLMLDQGALRRPGYAEDTLAHEFGHYLGLRHTFDSSDCPNGYCKDWEICTEGNNGDLIWDTPTHKKQGKCPANGANSCPNLPGKDPLDNFMSYSDCPLLRFTPEQVKRMQKTVSDYYPACLTNPHGQQPKDLPCNPQFPNKVVPSGYAPPR